MELTDKPKDIIEALHSKDYFAPVMKGKKFAAWEVFLKALYGLEMDDDEKQLFADCAERTPRAGGFTEAYVICGRRGGKSFTAALIGVYEGLFGGFEDELSAGENSFIFIVATDRAQAKIILQYVRGILAASFPEMIERDLTWEVYLKNRIIISVKSCTFRTGRGFSTAAILCDEVAFWRDENSANPATEVLDSLMPGLQNGGKLIALSTPYAKFGTLYETYKEYFGKSDSDILVFKAPTLTMNPTYKQGLIDRFMKRDKAVARSEYFSEFREDVTNFLSEDQIDSSTLMGIELQPFMIEHKYKYKAFCDPSGGKSDSMTLAIAHADEGFCVLDFLMEIKAPFNPTEVVKTFVDVLRRYGIHEIEGDKYAGEWCSSAFKKRNISYIPSKLDKSQIYLEFQALISMHRVMLLDNKRLKQQLLSLERRVKSGGRDTVDHPQSKGMHDDVCNAACGAVVGVFSKEISTKATEDEIKSRMPSVQSAGVYKKQYSERAKLRAAAKEMHQIMMDSGCNQLAKKKDHFYNRRTNMKEFQTQIISKSEESVQIPEKLIGSTGFYKIEPGKSVTIKNTDKENYLSPFEKIIITGPKGSPRCKVKKRNNWSDPFKDSPRRTEMMNFGGFSFLEIIFVQAGESYNLIKGIPIVCETQPNTWVEKYKSIKIEEPYNRQMPSREYPGEIDVIQVQNITYETRDEAEIESIRQRRKEEKNKIRV